MLYVPYIMQSLLKLVTESKANEDDTCSSESEIQERDQLVSESRNFVPERQRGLFLLATYKHKGTAAVVLAARKQLMPVGAGKELQQLQAARPLPNLSPAPAARRPIDTNNPLVDCTPFIRIRLHTLSPPAV
jgi:hypothetical protein